ncbi:MAG TPA: hypothetical protein VM639_07355 [Dongiaceae bacterium]|nr:hypothetical protein [Dongiaceae bacterium]
MSFDSDTLLTGWKARGSIFKPDTGIWWLGGGAGAFCLQQGEGDLVRMFLTGRDRTVRTRIGAVTLRWNERPEVVDVTPEPIFDLGELGSFDMDGVSYPWVVENDGALFMYYVGWLRLGGHIPFQNQIGLAASTDGGRTFKRVTRRPLLPQSNEEYIGNGSCYVERVPGGWRMYYTSFLRWELRDDGPRHYYHIKEAYSKDGIDWERPRTVIVDLIPPEEYALGAPDILDMPDGKALLFTARGHRYRLFVSVEDAAGKWRRLPDSIDLPRSDFDAEMQCYPRTFRQQGRTYLFYSGDGYGRAGIGYAEWQPAQNEAAT